MRRRNFLLGSEANSRRQVTDVIYYDELDAEAWRARIAVVENLGTIAKSGTKALLESLKRADVKFFRDLHDGIYGLTIYIADPDGNMIELYEADAKMG